MPQKIKIISLEKPSDYIKKERDAVESFKVKLLRDSDWTQLFDVEITPIELLRWRHWRHLVRLVRIGPDNYEKAKLTLEKLELTRPISKHSTERQYITTQLNYTDILTFKESAKRVYIECFPSKAISLKRFSGDIARTKSINTVFEKLLEAIESGY